jgi:hypothetical protein
MQVEAFGKVALQRLSTILSGIVSTVGQAQRLSVRRKRRHRLKRNVIFVTRARPSVHE